MRRRARTLWKRALKRKRGEDERRAAASPRQGPAAAAASTSAPAGVDPAAAEKLVAHERPQDVPDPRAKNAGHGRKTADKWNQ